MIGLQHSRKAKRNRRIEHHPRWANVCALSPKGSLALTRPEDESNRADQVTRVYCKLAFRSCGRDTDATAPCGSGASLSRIAS
jgi:hypothetical protein